jgi:hypothetical protein
MSIFLKAELETDVVGDGDGFISFVQKLPDDQKILIWLSVHQFEVLIEQKDHIISEAWGIK